MNTQMVIVKANGKTEKLNAYIGLMCQIGGDDIIADLVWATTKSDVYAELAEKHPGYKTKTINKLYPEDFMEDQHG